MRRIALALPLVLLVLPSLALAVIVNGNFETPGCFGWTPSPPPNWTVDCPTTGGNPNGYGHIMSPFGNSQGTGCLSQTFQCGDPGANSDCAIALDFKLQQIDANFNSARVKIVVDGATRYTSASMTTAWTHVMFTVPCGSHTLQLCLEVDAGNNGWAACFDNVTAECMQISAIRPATWGRIKTLYR